jgi:hypothetical protein
MTLIARLAAGAYCLVLGLPALADSYVDRVLDDGPQPSMEVEQEAARTSGWPRGLRIETNLARDSGLQHTQSQGISLSGFIDTPDYGALSLSAATSTSHQQDDARGGGGQGAWLWRVDQRALPLNDGWLANHSVGDVSTLQVPMARSFGRIGLPTSPMEGLAAEYTHGSDLLVNASLGKPGVFSGLGVNGFNASRGILSSFGGQQVIPGFGGTSALAFQFSDASRIEDSANPALDQNVRGLWSAWRWEGTAPWSSGIEPGSLPLWQREGGLQVQANVMGTHTDRASAAGLGSKEDGVGAWIDAQWRNRWLQQAAGVYYLEPNLRWGTYNAVSDLRGAYWRGDVATRRWQISGSLDGSDSISGTGGRSLFANVTGRYRVDTRNTAFAAGSVRRLNAPGESAQLGWEHLSDWGQTQWVTDALRAKARRSSRFGVDHSFLLASNGSVGISGALERSSDADRSYRTFSYGVTGSVRPWSSVSLEANLRAVQGGNARHIDGNVGVGWDISSKWTLLAQLSSTSGQDPLNNVLVSALTQAANQATPAAFSARRFQLTLRYQDRAGQAMAPIGGPPGTGAGRISGYVFYDANNNGSRQALEAGVPDVTIRLDERYVARTDAQGRYEFPAVAAGIHRLQIIPDNVPLPWSPALQGLQTIEVLVRSESMFNFPLRRD